MSYDGHTHLWLEPLHLLYKKTRALPRLRYRIALPIDEAEREHSFCRNIIDTDNHHQVLIHNLSLVDNARNQKFSLHVT